MTAIVHTRPTVNIGDVLVAAQAFELAQSLAEICAVTAHANYGGKVTPVIAIHVANNEAGVDALEDLFLLGDDLTPESRNYTRGGMFQGRSVEVYSGRSV
jgi:hypothetical protein